MAGMGHRKVILRSERDTETNMVTAGEDIGLGRTHAILIFWTLCGVFSLLWLIFLAGAAGRFTGLW